MKLLILIAFLGVSINFVGAKSLTLNKHAELVKYINSLQTSWKANENYEIAQRVQEIFTLYGGCERKIASNLPVKKYSEEDYLDLPKNFDSREKWLACKSIGKIRDQSSCGSCWAFGSTEAITDRICIAKNGTENPSISSAHVTACEEGKLGCLGGFLQDVYEFYSTHGIVTGGGYNSNEGCWPYPLPQCEHHNNKTHYKPCPSQMYPTPECVKKCRDGYEIPFEKDRHFGGQAHRLETVKDIQKDIFEHGSVAADIDVYTDFFVYQGGVYKHEGGGKPGGHVVKLFGWGEENGQEFWWATNSWNEDWGDKGFFKILKGSNECSIESNVVGSLPKTN